MKAIPARMAEDGIDRNRYQFWMQGANIIRRAETLFIALSISSSVGRGRQASRSIIASNENQFNSKLL
jgi:hypothetical protein